MTFHLPKEVHEVVVKLYLEHGYGAPKIIKELELNISVQTLIRYLKRNGVETRQFNERLPQPCKACGEIFEKDAWNRQLCLTCAPDKAWSTRYYNYGVTKPDFDKQLELQNWLCDLCGKPLPNDYTAMRFDHCHRQNHMRGILHNKCNIGLHYIEDTEFLGLAVKYSEKWKR